MNTEEVFLEIDKTIIEFIQILFTINQDQINTVPFKGSWTAGQIAQHVICLFQDLRNNYMAWLQIQTDNQMSM
jgi:hypothetical protein